jgi:hypothetical protein
MFDFVVFRRTGTVEKLVDVGLLAETLLFYQKVHIILDQESLAEFIRIIGLDQLVSLLDRPNITASFQRNMTGVVNSNGIILYNYTLFRVTRPGDKPIEMDDRTYVRHLVERYAGKSKAVRRASKRLCSKLVFSPLPESGTGIDDILGSAASDLTDNSFVRSSIVKILSIIAPDLTLPMNWRFSVQFVGSQHAGQPQFAIDTNLNFEAVNSVFHQRVPASFASLSPAYLLTHICSAREAQYISATHMSELIMDSSTSEVMRLRHLELMKKRDRQVLEMDLFQDMVLPGNRDIRGAINGGQRSFAEFITVLDKASKFKSFIASQNPDKALLDSFYSEVRKTDWISSLPIRATRFVFCTGLGLAVDSLLPTGGIATLTSIGYSLFDATILETIMKGWRPNQFIDNQLAPFVSGK